MHAEFFVLQRKAQYSWHDGAYSLEMWVTIKIAYVSGKEEIQVVNPMSEGSGSYGLG